MKHQRYRELIIEEARNSSSPIENDEEFKSILREPRSRRDFLKDVAYTVTTIGGIWISVKILPPLIWLLLRIKGDELGPLPTEEEVNKFLSNPENKQAMIAYLEDLHAINPNDTVLYALK
ncbi:MAG: hypothetical protein NC820_07675, partial [Candidatus Omnitrophica bacterium]|nr:hypothetical protein [Candidatus Omnitrophota bacterium]